MGFSPPRIVANQGLYSAILQPLKKEVMTLMVTPLKINMERNHGGLEDHFPFKMGDL